ncbi:MAG: HlyD family efflux transporter periplasmic adaptor subunit [Candidatus Syntrophonatronum acetioxidans]|uniref:HlyD family efflux transporter periplasmic adaptor subunit n=1 Tax=Candidatus Syntrophonatronum acetioxidans TaxID=1795816 RepID=A0A424Y9P2_9FIRM|nr:MAG: HlyD family efflux transporter periplasmic adaptor subunit [Candidatus Syntrophonatronum acetioxidans]
MLIMGKNHFHLIEGKKKEKGGKTEKFKKAAVWFVAAILFLFIFRYLFTWGFSRAASFVANTYIVEEKPIDSKFSREGIIIRDEKLIAAPWEGYLLWAVENGERIGAGKVVAEIVEEVSSENTVEENGEEAGEGPDFYEVLEPVEVENKTGAIFDNLRENVTKGNMVMARDYFQELKYFSQEVMVRKSFSSGKSEIVTPFSGIAVFKTDGLEDLLTPDNINFLSYEQMQDFEPNIRKINSGERVRKGAPLVKIVDNYSWYFSVYVNSSQAEKIRKEGRIYLKFNFAPGEEVQARVYNIEEDEDNRFLVTFMVTEHLKDFYMYRQARADIIYDRSRGVTVPSSALVYKEDEPGVYSVEKAMVRFRPVEIVSSFEEELLVEGLSRGRLIITNPRFFKEGQYIHGLGEDR